MEVSSCCGICMLDYSRSTCVEVRCDYCEFGACRGCYERWVRESVEELGCMSCKKKWNRKELMSKFTKKYIEGEYKRHMEDIVYQVEVQLLGETQRELERLRKIQELEKLKKEKELELEKIKESITQLRWGKKEKVVYTRKCPGELCRGYLKEDLSCGMCEILVCKNCNEICKELHECKDSDMETVRMLAKDTKPCPGCGEYIQKLEGCDQMFCVKCKSAFSWKTMKIETGAIHNPHYFEYLRNGGNLERNPMEIVCGREELDNGMLERVIRKGQNVGLICGRIIHMREVDLEMYTRAMVKDNRDIRKRYLQKEIDSKKFKSLLQQRNKRKSWNSEIAGIVGMFITSMTDIIYRYEEEEESSGEEVKYYREMEELREYANECMEEISRVYNYKCKKIGIDYFIG